MANQKKPPSILYRYLPALLALLCATVVAMIVTYAMHFFRTTSTVPVDGNGQELSTDANDRLEFLESLRSDAAPVEEREALLLDLAGDAPAPSEEERLRMLETLSTP